MASIRPDIRIASAHVAIRFLPNPSGSRKSIASKDGFRPLTFSEGQHVPGLPYRATRSTRSCRLVGFGDWPFHLLVDRPLRLFRWRIAPRSIENRLNTTSARQTYHRCEERPPPLAEGGSGRPLRSVAVRPAAERYFALQFHHVLVRLLTEWAGFQCFRRGAETIPTAEAAPDRSRGPQNMGDYVLRQAKLGEGGSHVRKQAGRKPS